MRSLSTHIEYGHFRSIDEELEDSASDVGEGVCEQRQYDMVARFTIQKEG
jgi:hypothetical protein